MDLSSILNDMIVSGLGLGLVAGAYALWWLSGFIPNLFSPKKWSWRRGAEDLCKALLMGLMIVAGVGLLTLGGQFFAILGWDITEGASEVSTYALSGAIATGFGMYMKKALSNGWKFFKLKSGQLTGDEEQYNEGVKQISDGVRDFLETITQKTSKEQFEEDGAPEEVLEGEALTDIEAGMGGFTNTYPEPYVSRAQDSMIDPSTCYNRECVSYTAWKIYELTGKWPTRTGGMNARYWVQRLAENGYTKVVDLPQNGGKYVGVSEAGTYGHVVWYEVDNVISEYNYLQRGCFSTRTINLSAYKWVEIQAPATSAQTALDSASTSKKTVSYTYQKGDTFGAVITKLGLKTSRGLWGPDGDVNYYTSQLGITGNIPVGTKLKFTPRKG